MSSLLYPFLISLLINTIIIHYFNRHSHLSSDTFDGPQKFHHTITPRIGGLAIFLAFLIMVFLNFYNTKNILIIKLLFSSLPVFIVGFVEDITKKVSPGIRLLSAAISGMIFIYSTGFFLNKLDLYILDNLFTFRFFAIFITIIAIAGVSNSINIIDGFNGLSAIVSIAILFSLGYVAFKVSDLLILNVSFILIGAIGGFFIWNYPFGKIFLGDGGAYFIGFMIATLSIILVERNTQVSPWFPLLSAIYPIFETLFSMYRRKFIHKTKMDRPDAYHLHQLIYKRVVPYVFNIHRNNKLMRNSATSPFLWLICSIGVIPAVLFYNNTIILITFTVIFCLLYIIIYRRIVKFKLIKTKYY